MPSILLAAFCLLIRGKQFARGGKCAHDALPVLRRILLRRKVRQDLKIVRGRLVFTNEENAIRSVLINRNTVGKTKYRTGIFSVYL